MLRFNVYSKDVTMRNGELVGIVAFETIEDRENALKQLHGQRLNDATVYVYEVSNYHLVILQFHIIQCDGL
jgi:hypothetical protein